MFDLRVMINPMRSHVSKGEFISWKGLKCLEQAEFFDFQSDLCAIVHAQLASDVMNMPFDCPQRDEQFPGNIAIGRTLSE
jgi:hypothetical protein